MGAAWARHAVCESALIHLKEAVFVHCMALLFAVLRPNHRVKSRLLASSWLSVHLSVPTQQFSHRTDFREISYFGIFTKICRNIRILSKSDLNNRQFTRRFSFSPEPICATVETGEIQERCEISRNGIHNIRIPESPMCPFMCWVRKTSHYSK